MWECYCVANMQLLHRRVSIPLQAIFYSLPIHDALPFTSLLLCCSLFDLRLHGRLCIPGIIVRLFGDVSHCRLGWSTSLL
jgi:hypothetical protein